MKQIIALVLVMLLVLACVIIYREVDESIQQSNLNNKIKIVTQECDEYQMKMARMTIEYTASGQYDVLFAMDKKHQMYGIAVRFLEQQLKNRTLKFQRIHEIADEIMKNDRWEPSLVSREKKQIGQNKIMHYANLVAKFHTDEISDKLNYRDILEYSKVEKKEKANGRIPDHRKKTR